MYSQLLKLLSLLLFLSACQKSTTPITSNLQAETIANVAYGDHSLQKMDIYLPEGRTNSTTRVIVLIHGGGWSGGDKSEFIFLIPNLKRHFPDYAIFNVNYRLVSGTENLFPAQEMDIKAAVEFIAANRNTYNISDKLVIMGASAGAHLALLQGYKYSNPIKAKAVVDFFGPTDLMALYNYGGSYPSLLSTVTGQTPETNAAIYSQSSPVNFIDQSSPPTIALHGEKDPTVPLDQPGLLISRLTANSISNQLVLYPNQGHGWIGPDLEDSFMKIADFLAAHVK